MKLICIAALCIALTACGSGPNGVRLTRDALQMKPAPKAPVAIAARTEPVFFNGKIYKVHLQPKGLGIAQVKITGMSASQSKDAAQMGKSSFQHFSCREKQSASLSTPVYEGGFWVAEGRCV